MILFYQPELVDGSHFLDKQESIHCVKVLRRKENDLIHITDGLGKLYHAQIINPDPKRCTFEIQKVEEEPVKHYSVHIAIAPTKNMDRMEWFVEKATEIGINEISLIKSQNSERTIVKTERLIKKAISAMKQSLKYTLPKINELKPLKDVLSISADVKCIAYVDSQNPDLLSNKVGSGKNIVLIGPEGDFTENEITSAITVGWKPVSLGNSRLRTETAGLVACHLINVFN